MRLRLPGIVSPWKAAATATRARATNLREGKGKMKIAVEGCSHGELDAIYASLNRIEREKKIKVDLLLIGGDFQVEIPPHPLLAIPVHPLPYPYSRNVNGVGCPE